MKTQYIEAIKRFEGFTAKAKWDFAQNTNGYGTKALYPGEVIGKEDAEHRFAAEVAGAKAAVARFAPGLDEGTAAALTSLTFNAGPGWMHSGLGAAVKAGDLEAAKNVFVQYVHAGGQRLPGLEARRASEVQWIGQQQPAAQEGADRGGNVGTLPGVPAEAKDVSAEREDVRAAATSAMDSYPAARPGSAVPGPSDALAHVFLLETIAIVLAARRSRQDHDDHDLARAART